MGRSNKNRRSTAKDSRKSKRAHEQSKSEEENVTSDTESECSNDDTTKRPHSQRKRPNKRNRKSSGRKGEESDESNEYVESDESDDEPLAKHPKRSIPSSINKKSDERDEENEVETIVSHKRSHGRDYYLIKWKDHSKGETWETEKKVSSLCSTLLSHYIREKKDHPKVETKKPVNQQKRPNSQGNKKNKKTNGRNTNADESDSEGNKKNKKTSGRNTNADESDETYECEETDNETDESDADALIIYPKRSKPSKLSPMNKKSDEPDTNMEDKIEAITSHRYQDDITKYRIQWKDSEKGQTWEIYGRLATICPNIFRDYIAQVDKANEVESIVSHERSHGHSKFLIKWKDQSQDEKWISDYKAWRLCPTLVDRYIYETKKAKDEKLKESLEVEAIVSYKRQNSHCYYLIKWKDHSKGETWHLKKTALSLCPALVDRHNEEMKEAKAKALEVEQVVSHKRDNGHDSYLIRWKDHSKEEKWVSKKRAMSLCPTLIDAFIQEEKKAEDAKWKEFEVESIGSHKKDHGRDYYLVKWKDHSKGETWETSFKVMSAYQGKDLLDEFVRENPDCAPVNRKERYHYKEDKKRKRKRKRKVEISDEEYDEDNAEWEVKRILGMKFKKGNTRAFLVRWKGYDESHDSWEAEENLKCPDLIEKFLSTMH